MAQEDNEIHQRLEKIGEQNTLFGKSIPLTQFKNLQQKQETKAKVLAKFKGDIFRSIISGGECGGKFRMDKLERLQQKEHNSENSTIERIDAFGRKDLKALSTFNSTLTMAYINLLCPEGKVNVIDFWSGHNSRCADVLSMGKCYVGFDVFDFPLEMCKKYAQDYPEEDYLLLKQSSEEVPFADETFDFSINCPPYFSVEKYSKIYGENKEDDLSNKTDKEFLLSYSKCINEMFRVLKKGAYSVIVVGDTYENQQLKSLMLETIKISKKAGFILHDLNIYNRGSNVGMDLNPVFFLTKLKRFGCIHEYIIILKKPEDKNAKN